MQTKKDYSILSMILGIAGIVFVVIGIIPAILAIIFASISLKNKTTRKPQAIIGLITGIFAIIWSIIVISIASLILSGDGLNLNTFDQAGGTYQSQVEDRINEKKNFAAGETARMGTIDLKVTSVDRNYTPAANEAVQPGDRLPKEDQATPGVKNTAIAESDAEYVLVRGTVVGNRSEPLGDSDADTSYLTLNNVDPIFTRGGYRTNVKTASSIETEFYHVYRIRQGSDSLILQNNVSIYTAILPIVGYEGAPTKELVYTLRLN
jgi:uncharacterized membrane protein